MIIENKRGCNIMGLFSKKSDKSSEKISEPFLPKLPDFPEQMSGTNYGASSLDNFPSYTPAFSTPSLPPSIMTKKKEYPPLRPKMHNGEEKPLFVKIENYKDAMKTLDRVKEELKRTDEVLEKINEIRSNEEKELESWHNEIRKLKDRLLEIDKKLFESEEA